MRRPGTCLAIVLWFGSAAVAAERWVEVRSPHFVVRTNAGEKTGRNLAWQFEQVSVALQRLVPWAKLEPGRPFLVLGARNEDTLRELAPRYWERDGYRPVSVWVSGQCAHYLALTTDVRRPDSRSDNPYFTVYQGYVGLVLDGSFPSRLPLWLLKGLSQFLANSLVKEDKIEVGLPVLRHIERLRTSGRLRVAELLAVDRTSRYYTHESEAWLFDAESWAFVHMLLLGEDRAHTEKLSRLIGMLRDGRPADQAFAGSLGDPDQYDGRLALHIGRELLPYSTVPASLRLEKERFSVSPVSPAAIAATKAGFHVAMNRPVEAAAAIAEAKQADPSLPEAWDAEGLLLDRQGKREEARASFARAIELGSKSDHTHYRLAQLLWKPDADEALNRQIATRLEEAIRLNPGSASAHSFLADTQVTLGDVEAGLRSAERAVELELAGSYHRRALARALSRAGQHDAARREAERALALSESESDTKDAQSLLQHLDATARAQESRQRAEASAAARTACFQARQGPACQQLAPRLQEECYGGGRAEACAALAWLNVQGLGLETDLVRGAELYARACQQGETTACLTHALMLSRGEGVPKDVAGAKDTLEKLCASDQPQACTALAVLVVQGSGANLKRARSLLQKACDHDEAEACRLLASLPR
jgi:TPR repeat protein